MKILLLSDEQGTDMKLYRTPASEIILTLTDDVGGTNLNYIFDKDDVEYLICELARLRDIPF